MRSKYLPVGKNKPTGGRSRSEAETACAKRNPEGGGAGNADTMGRAGTRQRLPGANAPFFLREAIYAEFAKGEITQRFSRGGKCGPAAAGCRESERSGDSQSKIARRAGVARQATRSYLGTGTQ